MERSNQKPDEDNDPTLTVIVLGGPTGSGKNRLALEIAQRFGGEIVNADSRQIYQGLALGTNQPSDAEMRMARHHLYGFLKPDEAFSVADYERRVLPTLREISARNRLPILVGGTGFYIRAALKGVWPVPAHDPDLRKRLRRIEGGRGKPHLHAILKRLDPQSAAGIPANDSYRVIRSLEIYLQTGKRRSEIQHRLQDRFAAHKYFLDVAPSLLESHIHSRTESMFEAGWADEVKGLLRTYPGFPSLPASRSLGYPEILSMLDGKLTFEQCKSQVIRKTLQYAKRQRTWFRNQDQFLPVSSSQELHKKLDSVLQ